MPLDAETAAKVRYLARETNLVRIAKAIDMDVSQVGVWARYHKIKPLSFKEANTPSWGEWLGIASQVAQEAGLPVRAITGKSRRKVAVVARWMAYKRLLEEYPEYSIAGLARTAGRDHTGILYGLAQLRGPEADHG